MTLLAAIRHGPTAWNVDKRLQGHTDVQLSDEGRKLVAGWRVPPEYGRCRWVTSPLARAVETARLLGVAEPEIEPRLIEMNYGEWEGRRLAELRETLGGAMAENEARGIDFRPEGGERPREVRERLIPWLRDVGRRGQETVAVTHHGVLRVLYALATGWDMVGSPPEKLRWGALHCFRVARDGQLRLERINLSIAAE